MESIWTDPERLSGTPLFYGSRVPVAALFDYLEGGYTVTEFLEQYPSVRLELVETVIRTALDALIRAHRQSGDVVTGVVSTDREIQGGTPCFVGTRVPVKTLFDHLAHGYSMAFVLEDFPTVTSDQAKAALKAAKDALLLPLSGTTAR